jgi:hypothetical protein
MRPGGRHSCGPRGRGPSQPTVWEGHSPSVPAACASQVRSPARIDGRPRGALGLPRAQEGRSPLCPRLSTEREDKVPLTCAAPPARDGRRPRPPHGVLTALRLKPTAPPALPYTPHGSMHPEPLCASTCFIAKSQPPKARRQKHPVGWTLALRLRTSTTSSCARGWPCGLYGSFLSVP